MSAYYAVTITIGPYSWAIESTDVIDPDEDQVLGGLDFGWVMPEQDVMPSQPDPMDAAVAVLVGDINDYTDAQVGLPVSIVVKLDPAGPIAFSFYGRVTDLQAVPASRGGMYLSVVAMDYTVDERPIGLVDWPDESFSGRYARIWDEAQAGAYPTLALNHPLIGITNDVDARTAAKTTLPAALAEYLPTFIGENPAGGYGRYILAPLVDGGLLDTAQNFALDALTGTVTMEPPGEFGLTEGGDYGIVFDPDPVNFVLDGGYVHRSATWTQRKYGAVELLVVTLPDGAIQFFDERGAVGAGAYTPGMVTAELSTPFDLLLPNDGSIGVYYFPDGDTTTRRWEVDGFTYELSRDIEDGNFDPADLTNGWMPDHAASEGHADRTACFLRPIVVDGIPEAQNPGSGGFYSGQLRGARLSIAKGRMRLDFAVRRALPAIDGDQLTPAGLAASAFSAVTVAQLDPDFTVYDYRLCREA